MTSLGSGELNVFIIHAGLGLIVDALSEGFELNVK